MPSQWERFKQSNIAKIVIGYSLVVWVLIQLIEAVLPTFETPLWVAQTLTFLLILGFPIALLVGWAYEKLPARSNDTDGDQSVPQPAHSTPRKTLVLVGVGSCAVIGLFGFYMMPFIFDQSAFNGPSTGSQQNLAAPMSNFRGIRSSLLIGETGVRNFHNTRSDIAITKDGRHLAFLRHDGTESELFIRDLSEFNSERSLGIINNIQGSGLMFFSEDDEWLHFINGGKLARVRFEGGSFQSISDNINVLRSGFTSFNEQVIFSNAADSQLYSIPVSGGTAVKLELDETDEDRVYVWPRALPNESHLLVTSADNVNRIGSGAIELYDLENGVLTRIIETASNATYVSTGHIVFIRDSALWSVPFDIDTLEITGPQVPVIQNIENNSAYGHATYAISDTGKLFYIGGTDVGGGGSANRATWVSRDGNPVSTILEPNLHSHLSLSPAEDQFAVTIYEDSGASDIWVWDLARQTLGRRTFDGQSSYPIWSPDGSQLIYFSDTYGLKAVASNGTEQPVELIKTTTLAEPTSVSDDGTVVFSMGSPLKVYAFDPNANAAGERVATELDLAPTIPDWHGTKISPDGNWLAYVSNEAGVNHVYVRPYPDINGGKWQVSTIDGLMILWSPQTSELFYESQDFRQMRVGYSVGLEDENGKPTLFELEVPQEMFRRGSDRNAATRPTWDYSVSRDQFLILERGTNDDTAQQVLAAQTNVSMVEDWFMELSSLSVQSTN